MMVKEWLFLVCLSYVVTITSADRKVFKYDILRDFPKECYEAKPIDDSTRRFDIPADSTINSNQADNRLEPGWYWFQGASGNVLMEGYEKKLRPGVTPPNFCGTVYSGTLMGSHPREEEGIVEMTVCFRPSDCYKQGLVEGCECRSKQTIYVRNCRRHFIYFLRPTQVSSRYCTNQIRMPDRNAAVNISTITECKQYRSLPKGTGITSTRLWNRIEDVSCDDGDDVYGWYRYARDEGGEMAGVCLENQNATSSRFGQPCGANFRGWMVDQHPRVEDGRVQRRICFSYDTRCYCEFYKNIAVRNCGSYYVYRLSPVKTCKSRYCGAPADQKSKDMDFKKPEAIAPVDMCKDYNVQYDPDRLWSFTNPTVFKCDSDLYGKYRFGSRFTPWRMKEGCDRRDSRSVIHRCGTQLHGYMIGKHPVQKEGYVERLVCFENADGPCECRATTTVGVQNCGGYYVYYLRGVPSCSARYCMVANNTATLRLNPGLPPLYEIPTPNEKPVVAKVEKEKDDNNGGLVAATAALSIIILIVIIVLIIIIIILIVKVWPAHRRRQRGRETPSYVSSAHEDEYPMMSAESNNKPSKKKGKNKQPSNGDLPNEPEQIAPYPSVLPDDQQLQQEGDHHIEDTDSVAERGQASDDDMRDIPENLEGSLSDEDENDNNPTANDCDTLMKKEDFNKPQSYDNLPSRDSEV